jgi:hypothetical protein
LTTSGLLFATLSLDAPSFKDYFADLEELTNKVDFTKLPHRRSISYEGKFNWKTMLATSSHFPHFLATHDFLGLMASKNASIANTRTPPSPNFTHPPSTP